MGLIPLKGQVMGSCSGDPLPGRGPTRPEPAVRPARLAGDNDLRAIVAAAQAGDDGARLALDVYCHRIRGYVGACSAVLGTVDAVVLTGGR